MNDPTRIARTLIEPYSRRIRDLEDQLERMGDGRGTCRMERVTSEGALLEGWLICSECGPVYPPCNAAVQNGVRFCPYCGRKVVK